MTSNIDKKKVWIIGGIAAVVIAVIVVLIVIAVQLSVQNKRQQEEHDALYGKDTTTSASPTPQKGNDDGQPQADYDSFESVPDSVYDTAEKVGLLAAAWDGTQSDADRTAAYETAGMSPELAASYKPVWAEVFANVPASHITITQNGAPGLNTLSGDPGHQQVKVGVSLKYSGTWTHAGRTDMQVPADATWWVTIDEASGKAVAIDQPSTNDVQIRVSDEGN